jgi:CheY-like chemotaxis protein
MNGLLRGWNCSVYSFSSAKEALESVSSCNGQPPDLIIADYSLPDGKSGVELIADLRSAIGTDIAAFLSVGIRRQIAFARCAQVGCSFCTNRSRPSRSEPCWCVTSTRTSQPYPEQQLKF